MAANRYSTSSLKNNGANIRTVETSNGYSTTYDNSTGNQIIVPTDGNLSYTVPESTSPNIYSYLLGYYMSRGYTKITAQTAILITLDTAKSLNIGPIELVQNYSHKLNLNDARIISENSIRTDSLKVGYITVNQNTNSKVRGIKV